MARPGAAIIDKQFKEDLAQYTGNKELRDSIDKSDLSIIKGKEHIVLYFIEKMLMAQGEHNDEINEYLYKHFNTKMEQIEGKLAEASNENKSALEEIKNNLQSINDKIPNIINEAIEKKVVGINEMIKEGVKTSVENMPIMEEIKKVSESIKDANDILVQIKIVSMDSAKKINEFNTSMLNDEMFKGMIKNIVEESIESVKIKIGELEGKTESVTEHVNEEIKNMKDALEILTKSTNKHLDKIDHKISYTIAGSLEKNSDTNNGKVAEQKEA